jgi:hypothetical protein
MKTNTQSQGTNGAGQNAAADGTPAVVLTPDQIVEQLRILRTQMPATDPLTDQERKLAKEQARLGGSPAAVQATINAIGTADELSAAVGTPAPEAQQLMEEEGRWSIVEAELKEFLKGVSDANLTRRMRLGLIVSKAYGIAKLVARDNAKVRPHVSEIRNLRKLARRKKASTSGTPQTPQSPTTSPEPPAASADTSAQTKQ